MTTLARISVLTVLALAGVSWAVAAQPEVRTPIGTAFPLCQVPVTKGYYMQPGFCAPQVAAMIPSAIGDGGDACCCGPFGIPPIYTAGNSVMVRTSPEVHERVAQFLVDLGAYVPQRPK